MEVYVVFGLPGAGKSFVGQIMQKYFGFYLYDNDAHKDMPRELKNAIAKQENVTDDMRDKFFKKLIKSVKKLKTKYDRIVIPQTFIKEKYREQFLKEILETKFILVETNKAVREERLMKRKIGYQLELAYWRRMCEIFEEPQVDHAVVSNNNDGEENVREQLQVILK